jgi:uncharacterized membrane protein
MNRSAFLDALRRGLAGLPPTEIDDIVSDYANHFAEGLAAGRSEEDIAAALGDPARLARELRAEAGFRRWETNRSPANFFAVLLGFLALVTVDFVFLLPVLGSLLFCTLIAGIVALALCLAGFGVMMSLFSWHHGFHAAHALGRAFGGMSLLGFGIGGSALLVMLGDGVVRLLGRFARLHYTLLNQADPAL